MNLVVLVHSQNVVLDCNLFADLLRKVLVLQSVLA